MKTRRNFPSAVQSRRKTAKENLEKHLSAYSSGKHPSGTEIDVAVYGEDFAKKQITRCKAEIATLEDRLKTTY